MNPIAYKFLTVSCAAVVFAPAAFSSPSDVSSGIAPKAHIFDKEDGTGHIVQGGHGFTFESTIEDAVKQGFTKSSDLEKPGLFSKLSKDDFFIHYSLNFTAKTNQLHKISGVKFYKNENPEMLVSDCTKDLYLILSSVKEKYPQLKKVNHNLPEEVRRIHINEDYCEAMDSKVVAGMRTEKGQGRCISLTCNRVIREKLEIFSLDYRDSDVSVRANEEQKDFLEENRSERLKSIKIDPDKL